MVKDKQYKEFQKYQRDKIKEDHEDRYNVGKSDNKEQVN